MPTYTSEHPPVDTLTFLRESRAELLKQSDWTQSADSPLSDSKKAEWATYRQALRDLTNSYTNENSINDIVWPTRPE